MTQEEQNQRHGIAKPAKLYVIAVLTASLPGVVFAGGLPVPHPASDVTVTDPITDYFLHWFDRSEVAKASQPHWMTPITTVTPRLEQSTDMINLNNSCKMARKLTICCGDRERPERVNDFETAGV